jgi:GNAT superfamily N-acetyltransferase
MLTFRPASQKDAEGLTELTIASKAHWGYDEAFMALARPVLAVTGEYLDANECWVAESDGRTIGWFSLVEQPDVLLLDNLFLLPGHIGSGLGRQMWQHALSRAAARGAERLTLEADPNAAGFYERMGAVRIGTVTAASTGRELPVYEIALAEPEEPSERTFGQR